jgi:hypothetical protein
MKPKYSVLILLLALMTSVQCQQNAEDWSYQEVALQGQDKTRAKARKLNAANAVGVSKNETI